MMNVFLTSMFSPLTKTYFIVASRMSPNAWTSVLSQETCNPSVSSSSFSDAGASAKISVVSTSPQSHNQWSGRFRSTYRSPSFLTSYPVHVPCKYWSVLGQDRIPDTPKYQLGSSQRWYATPHSIFYTMQAGYHIDEIWGYCAETQNSPENISFHWVERLADDWNIEEGNLPVVVIVTLLRVTVSLPEYNDKAPSPAKRDDSRVLRNATVCATTKRRRLAWSWAFWRSCRTLQKLYQVPAGPLPS